MHAAALLGYIYEPVGCGGLRPLKDQFAGDVEVKRMYVVPEARGTALGVADLILRRLEVEAFQKGWTIVKLETGHHMTRARKFYKRHGYKEIQRFGHYVHFEQSVCYEKKLSSDHETST